MTIETTLVKRRALYQGEVGLFPPSPMAEEDISILANGEEVMVVVSSPKNLAELNYLWGVVHKVTDNTDRYRDRYHAMDNLKIRAGHYKLVWDGNKFEAMPKSLKRLSNERLRQLTKTIIDIVCQEIIPGMDENDLRREVEEWCHALPQQSKPAPRDRSKGSRLRGLPAF